MSLARCRRCALVVQCVLVVERDEAEIDTKQVLATMITLYRNPTAQAAVLLF
jgi:hypothetical protein